TEPDGLALLHEICADADSHAEANLHLAAGRNRESHPTARTVATCADRRGYKHQPGRAGFIQRRVYWRGQALSTSAGPGPQRVRCRCHSWSNGPCHGSIWAGLGRSAPQLDRCHDSLAHPGWHRGTEPVLSARKDSGITLSIGNHMKHSPARFLIGLLGVWLLLDAGSRATISHAQDSDFGVTILRLVESAPGKPGASQPALVFAVKPEGEVMLIVARHPLGDSDSFVEGSDIAWKETGALTRTELNLLKIAIRSLKNVPDQYWPGK